jgi:hypothetical protein
MADQFTYTKLPADPCLTQEQMLAYIDGKLSAVDQHACEKHIMDCGLCEDALEGLALVKDRTALSAPLLPEENKEEPKVIPLRPGSSNRKMWYAAAAVFVVVFSTVYFLNQFAGADMEVAENKSVNPDATVEAPVNPESSTLKSAENDESKDAGNGTDQRSESVFGDIVIAEETEQERMAPAPVHPDVALEIPAPEEPIFDLQQGATDPDDEYRDFNKVPASPKLAEDVKDEQTKQEAEEQNVTVEEKKSQFWDRAKEVVPIGGIQNNRSDKTTLSGDNKNADVIAPTAPQSSGTVAETGKMDSSGANTAVNLELSYQNGVEQLNAGQANTAIVLFDQVLQDKTHPRYEDAELQKAKALIKANRKAEAKTLLQSIEAKKGKHAAEATDLLKTL